MLTGSTTGLPGWAAARVVSGRGRAPADRTTPAPAGPTTTTTTP
jgi:hypothetical protein